MFIVYILLGIIGGVFGGMGLGGGTILIPILNIFFNVPQHIAQSINLVGFLPMAIVSIIKHLKNNLIEKKGLGIMIVSSLFIGIIFAILSVYVNSDILKRLFGGILVFFGIVEIILFTKAEKAKAKAQIVKIDY